TGTPGRGTNAQRSIGVCMAAPRTVGQCCRCCSVEAGHPLAWLVPADRCGAICGGANHILCDGLPPAGEAEFGVELGAAPAEGFVTGHRTCGVGRGRPRTPALATVPAGCARVIHLSTVIHRQRLPASDAGAQQTEAAMPLQLWIDRRPRTNA